LEVDRGGLLLGDVLPPLFHFHVCLKSKLPTFRQEMLNPFSFVLDPCGRRVFLTANRSTFPLFLLEVCFFSSRSFPGWSRVCPRGATLCVLVTKRSAAPEGRDILSFPRLLCPKKALFLFNTSSNSPPLKVQAPRKLSPSRIGRSCVSFLAIYPGALRLRAQC